MPDVIVEVQLTDDPVVDVQLVEPSPITTYTLTGPQGPQGIPGVVGPQGPVGATGPIGATGAVGADSTVPGPLGPVGPPGPTGPQGAASTVAGPVGPQGIQGTQGPQGEQGVQGIQGPEGEQGTSVRLVGSVASPDDLPAGLTLDDAGIGYIVTSDGDLWMWDGDSWVDVGQIVGPPGPQGVQGTEGIQGVAGPQGVAGEVEIVTLTQADYDAIVTPDPDTIYIISDGPGPVEGPMGPQGPAGVAGTAGAPGAPGADSTVPGPAGPPGPAGSPGMVWKGTWNPLDDYTIHDVVFYEGSSYIAAEEVPATSWVPATEAELWFEAEDLALTNGAAVSSWTSSGINDSIVLTQTVNHPTYQATAMNGHPAVRFAAAGIGPTPWIPASLAAINVIALVKASAAAAYMMAVTYIASFAELRLNGSGYPQANISTVVDGVDPMPLDTPVLMGMRWDDAVDTMWLDIDGVEIGSAPIGFGHVGSSSFSIGQRPPYVWQGDIAAVFLQGGPVLNLADRQRTEGGILWRYGLQGILPVGHPFKTLAPGSTPPDVDTRWELVAQGA